MPRYNQYQAEEAGDPALFWRRIGLGTRLVQNKAPCGNRQNFHWQQSKRRPKDSTSTLETRSLVEQSFFQQFASLFIPSGSQRQDNWKAAQFVPTMSFVETRSSYKYCPRYIQRGVASMSVQKNGFPDGWIEGYAKLTIIFSTFDDMAMTVEEVGESQGAFFLANETSCLISLHDI